MLKITIYYKDTVFFSHFGDHMIAIIEDEQNKKEFIVDHASFSYNIEKKIVNNVTHYVEKTYDGSYLYLPRTKDYVVLHSDKNLDDFIKEYSQKFNANSYNFLNKNCADAVNFTLDYFFPEKNIELNSTALKVLCFLPSIVFIGAKWFPTPGGLVTTPIEVFEKAKILAKLSNQKVEKPLEHKDITRPSLK